MEKRSLFQTNRNILSDIEQKLQQAEKEGRPPNLQKVKRMACWGCTQDHPQRIPVEMVLISVTPGSPLVGGDTLIFKCMTCGKEKAANERDALAMFAAAQEAGRVVNQPGGHYE